MFGRRKTPFAAPAGRSPLRIDSDGKRRVFGEAVFAGSHGNMLKDLGFGLDDPSNIVPMRADFDKRIQDSLAEQDQRRTQIENELLRQHGHNNIRPFFILAEPVFNSDLGRWLVMLMNLRPYDDWNVVYLPMDQATRAAMGDLPLHPQQSIGPIDELMQKQIGSFYDRYNDAKRKVEQIVAEIGMNAAADVLDRFVTYVDEMPNQILDHVARVKPMIVELILDVQTKQS